MTEELLSEGLVISGDPAYNKPGELTAAENAYYRHDDDGLFRYRGVASDVVVTSGYAINGITTCRYSDKHWIVAQANGAYWIADAETDGAAFASALAVTEGSPVTSLTHSNRWFIMNGVQQNQVLKSDGTFRRAGLLPTIVPPTFNGFIASAFSLIASGTYSYWYTEVFDDGAGVVLESAADSNAVNIVTISSTAVAPKFTLPAPINANITKYRVYRSTSQSSGIDLGYPVGQNIAELAYDGTNVVTFTDTSRNPIVSDPSKPGVVFDIASKYSVATATATNGINITATRTSVTGDSGHTLPVTLYAYSFTHWNIAEPAAWPAVNQYSVAFTGCVSATGATTTAGMVVDPCNNYLIPAVRNSTLGRLMIATTCQVDQLSSHGTSVVNVARMQPWYVSPVAGELNADYANFTLDNINQVNPRNAYILNASPITLATDIVPVAGNAQLYVYDGPGRNISGDWMLILTTQWTSSTVSSPATVIDFRNPIVTVNYLGEDAGSGDAYPLTIFAIDSATIQVSTNTPPPISAFGTVFEGQPVCNDIANKRSIRYGMGDEPEYWPSLYELILPIRDNDEITSLDPVGNMLVVGTKGSIWAISYLPNESDASINRGICMRQISDKHNIVNANCVVPFLATSGQQELAFVSTNGIFATNGVTIEALNDDLVWTSVYDSVTGPLTSDIYARCIKLTNDFATMNLKFFFQGPDNDTLVYSANYAKRHQKSTRFMGVYNIKWAGPTHVSKYTGVNAPSTITCVHSYKRNGGLNVILHGRGSGGDWSGSIAREDGEDTVLQNALPDSRNNSLGFTSRDIYLAGKGRQFQLKDAWLYGYRIANGQLDTPAGRLKIDQIFVNADVISADADILDAPFRTKLISVPVGNVNADAVRLVFKAANSDPYVLYSITFDASDGGDSKRA